MAYNLADLFEHTADVIPERTALICGDETRTYGQLDEQANRLAHHLAAAGVEPGQHVGIYAADSVCPAIACHWHSSCWAASPMPALAATPNST